MWLQQRASAGGELPDTGLVHAYRAYAYDVYLPCMHAYRDPFVCIPPPHGHACTHTGPCDHACAHTGPCDHAYTLAVLQVTLFTEEVPLQEVLLTGTLSKSYDVDIPGGGVFDFCIQLGRPLPAPSLVAFRAEPTCLVRDQEDYCISTIQVRKTTMADMLDSKP